MYKKPFQLTRHPIGSIREILTVSWPLMLGFVSTGIMIFVDRAFLGRYSLAAMNATTTAAGAALSFTILPTIIAGISEVFVGQYHGEGEYGKIGPVVWQLIWFALLCTPIFILLAFLMPKVLFAGVQDPAMATDYFRLFIGFGSFGALISALTGFFVGQGEVRIISTWAVVANIANIFLDLLLIFGWGPIPALGVKGAAIATILSEGVMVVGFFYIFMRKKNREARKTVDCRPDLRVFLTCLKVGFPASVAHVSEFFSYFLLLKLINLQGSEFLTIIVLLPSLYMLVFFIIEGLSKGVTSVCANLIGASQQKFIGKNLLSSLILHTCFVAFFASIFLLFSREIFTLFVNAQEQSIFADPLFALSVHKGVLFLCLYYLLDGWAWTFIGVLMGAGDTNYLMMVGIIAPWVVCLFPIYFALRHFTVLPHQIWMIFCLYALVLNLFFAGRYLSGAWRKKSIFREEESVAPILVPVEESEEA